MNSVALLLLREGGNGTIDKVTLAARGDDGAVAEELNVENGPVRREFAFFPRRGDTGEESEEDHEDGSDSEEDHEDGSESEEDHEDGSE
ncbi:hypothetical protein MMC07_006742 [Pseudocyphellaria aurata]|nr:hypothetical protein [Pseudocyphellaria aurata]